MIDPRIPLMGGQNVDLLGQTAKGIELGQGLRQMLALRQIGNMNQLQDTGQRQNFANNSMFSRELNAQIKAENAATLKAQNDALKFKSDLDKTNSETYKNNAQGGGYALENSGKKLGAIQGAFQQASLTGDPSQVLLGLNGLVRTGYITAEDYQNQSAIVKAMSPDELKQYAGGINFANSKDPASLQYVDANTIANNKQSEANSQRTYDASIHATDVSATTAANKLEQDGKQFQQNHLLNLKKQWFDENKPVATGVDIHGRKYRSLANGKNVYEKDDQGNYIIEQTKGSTAQNSQKEEAQRIERVDAVLPMIEELIPKATNSYAGRGLDYLVRGFGGVNDGDKATDQLETLSGQLVALMPKMSGPQSDKDVAMYKEMAGNLSNPTKSKESRLAALGTIRQLNEKYKTLNQQNNSQQSQTPSFNSYSYVD